MDRQGEGESEGEGEGECACVLARARSVSLIRFVIPLFPTFACRVLKLHLDGKS